MVRARAIRPMVLGVLVVALAACGGGGGGGSSPAVGLTRIVLAPESANVPLGLTLRYTATGEYTDGSTRDLSALVAWTCFPPSIAAVTPTGWVTPLAPGTTEVQVALGSVSASTLLTVRDAQLVALEIVPPSAVIAREATVALHARGHYTDNSTEDVTDHVAWTSDDPTRVAVDWQSPGAGEARGLAFGATIVRATFDGRSAQAGVRVILPLARSGQTTCFDAFGNTIDCAGTGQDGDLRSGAAWPAPRFEIGVGDESVCITDRLTGLQWLRAPSASTATGWTEALQQARALVAGGHSDWRLPTRRELRGLAHAEVANLASWLNASGFQLSSTDWWSCSTYVSAPWNAWNVDTLWGVADVYDKSGGPRLWPVRDAGIAAPAPLAATGQTSCYDDEGLPILCTGTGQDGELRPGAAWPLPRFTPGEGGEIDTLRDELTGLMWVRAPSHAVRTWQEALDDALALVLGGHDDWRLPNVVELESLYAAGAPDSATWLSANGFDAVPWGYAWTSTTTFGDSTTRAWIMHLGLGYVWRDDKSMAHYALAVRGP